MSKIEHNRQINNQNISFWSEHNPQILLDEISNSCFNRSTETIDGIERSVPCGKCKGCVMKRKREIVSNMIMESYTFGLDNCMFLTPTFNEDNIRVYTTFPETLSKNLRREYNDNPKDYLDSRPKVKEYFQHEYFHPLGVLARHDLEKYIQRIRNHFPDRKLKFYYCAEYGSRTYRPHFHLIVYGISSLLTQSKQFQDKMDKIWGKGRVKLLPVHEGGMAYVAKYTLEKMASMDFVVRGVPQEFQNGSKGLGFDWIDKNIIPSYVKRKWIPPNVGTMESAFIMKYFADRFNGLKSGIPMALVSKDKGYRYCNIPTEKHLSIQKSKRSVAFGEKPSPIRALVFDKVRQERIFNGVLASMGLTNVYNKCVHELHHTPSIWSMYERWHKEIASNTVELQESVTKGLLPMPEDRVNKIKFSEKLQRQMDKAD